MKDSSSHFLQELDHLIFVNSHKKNGQVAFIS